MTAPPEPVVGAVQVIGSICSMPPAADGASGCAGTVSALGVTAPVAVGEDSPIALMAETRNEYVVPLTIAVASANAMTCTEVAVVPVEATTSCHGPDPTWPST